MKTKLLMILAITMGILTTVLFYSYMKQFDVEAIVHEHLVEVVVAKSKIERNVRITADMLELIQVPENGLHPQAIKQIQDVRGKYATADIAAGEVLLSHRVLEERDEQLFVSRKVSDGLRAVSIGVNFVRSVSTLIEPEDYVDVIATREEKIDEEKEVITELILSKVRVLAVGRKMVEPNGDSDYVEYSAVTLELSDEDAVKLVNASEVGPIQLILHSRLTTKEAASHEPAGN